MEPKIAVQNLKKNELRKLKRIEPLFHDVVYILQECPKCGRKTVTKE